jgi:hypothetical protein
MGGASGTFAAMLDATEGESVTLPLSVGRIVVDELRLTTAGTFSNASRRTRAATLSKRRTLPLITAPLKMSQTREPRERNYRRLNFWVRDVRGAGAIRASAPSSMRAG